MKAYTDKDDNDNVGNVDFHKTVYTTRFHKHIFLAFVSQKTRLLALQPHITYSAHLQLSSNKLIDNLFDQ